MLHLGKALSCGKGNICIILIEKKKTTDNNLFIFLRSLNCASKSPFSFTLMLFGPLLQIVKQSPISLWPRRAWSFLEKHCHRKTIMQLAMLFYVKILDEKFWVTATFGVANIWFIVHVTSSQQKPGLVFYIQYVLLKTFTNFFTFSNTIQDR